MRVFSRFADVRFAWRRAQTFRFMSIQPPQKVSLMYQEPPPTGKITGRYINHPSPRDDVVDEIIAKDVEINDGRGIGEGCHE